MDDELYMTRCLQLARLGKGYVAPNPLVGAVLVSGERIVGEGYHRKYGGPHAEVDCLHSVKPEDRHLIPGSVLYVSLEPCSHFGKTPPCTDLILSEKIGRVVVGTTDPFPEVNGKGIEKLKAGGIDVTDGVLEADCRKMNRSFFHFHQEKRPYIILKWAQSADGKIAGTGPERTFISNIYSNRLVHQWRSEVMAIMVGSNTVVIDNPVLSTRYWPGKNPLRIVVDTEGQIDDLKRVMDGSTPTLVFNSTREETTTNLQYIKIDESAEAIPQIMDQLVELNIQSVMVEGGARLLQSFIDLHAWDEARVITNEGLTIGDGLAAPQLQDHVESAWENIEGDTLRTFFRKHK